MQRSFPGFLYAKSMLPDDAPAEGYQTWFLNPALKPHEGRLTLLRDSFRWRTDSSRRHPPVMVIDPIHETDDVIVVRFSDAGKDSFGRPQTLRMEAMLVPASLAGALWDGTFPAKPDPASAEFVVDVGPDASSFPGIGVSRLVNGDSANFSLAGYSNPAGPRPRVASEPPPRVPSTPSEPSRELPPSQPERTQMGKLFFITLLALLASIAVNMWQFGKAKKERDKLLDRLSQAERQREDLRAQMEGLEADRAAIATFKIQANAFADAIKELQRVSARLENIRTAMDSAAADSSADK